MRPPGLAVAMGQRRGRGPAGVGGALLVPGATLLARVECAADAHPSGEVGTVRRGSAADVVGRWGSAGRPLSWATAERKDKAKWSQGRKGKKVIQRMGSNVGGEERGARRSGRNWEEVEGCYDRDGRKKEM